MDSESSELISVIYQMISVFPRMKSVLTSNDSDSNSATDLDLQLLSLSSQLISLVSSMDLESESESEFISLIKKLLSVGNSISDSAPESHFVSLVTDIISRFRSIESDPDLMKDLDLDLELASSCRSALCLIRTMDSDSELKSLLYQILILVIDCTNLKAKQEAEQEMESKLISLITQLMSLGVIVNLKRDTLSQFITIIIQIISLICSTDLDSLPKPESELMSLTTKSISVFKSMSSLSQTSHERKVISRISEIYSAEVKSVYSEVDLGYHFSSDVGMLLVLKPGSELMSIFHQIFYLVISLNRNPELGKLISLCPQVQVELQNQKFHVTEEVSRSDNFSCLPLNWEKVRLTGGKGATHFWCRGCDGENHKEHQKAPVEVKHLHHPKHSLSLVSLDVGEETRECYCCDEDLDKCFYYCIACDCAMNVACVEKPPVLYRRRRRWHKHTLSLFPRQASLTCNLCALADSSSPLYMCPPCDFVVHLRCLNLPRVIRISRHLQRLSFTPSFDQGDWSCGVCRRKVNNDYGGYSCIKDGCSYVAHSRCATQRNVWDGVDLEGEPEEAEEEVEPFVRIGDGIIQHFSHQQHHLRLDENTSRNYVEENLCQACIMPIYSGNLYACLQCDYILHEECAKLSRKLHHPIHPHQLTLVGGHGHGGRMDNEILCSACPSQMCIAGFFYECGKEECRFKVHVQCATISEPLVHGSHIHPLFLTSKPGEQRICSICKNSISADKETFNSIETDFSLCFGCATLPQKVRYKHDKHILTLSYGKETSTLAEYWCEVCEAKLDPKKRFYICDEYCCVTLHIKCLIGEDLYMNPGSSRDYGELGRMSVLPNYQHMSRPFCSECKKRCLYKVVFRLRSGLIYCSISCIGDFARMM